MIFKTVPRLYLFVGPPGSGKTTVSHLIEDSTDAVHIWVDHERQKMFERVNHSQAESDKLYVYLNNHTDELLAAGKSVIFDTNFNYKKDRDLLRTIAQKHGAETVIIWMQTPIALARDRALHQHHRDRNGYDTTMHPDEFDRIIAHLEPPVNEAHLNIDGTDIDIEAVKRQLRI